MDDAAMLWGDAMGLCYHRSIASPHRPSHRLIVHRIASSSIASHHRPSHRLIVHRIASSSIASPHRPSRRRNASVTLLGHHTKPWGPIIGFLGWLLYQRIFNTFTCLGVSLTHVVNYLIHCIIFIYYFHILNCTVIFCL